MPGWATPFLTVFAVFEVAKHGFVNGSPLYAIALTVTAVGSFITPDLTFLIGAGDDVAKGSISTKAVPFYNALHRMAIAFGFTTVIGIGLAPLAPLPLAMFIGACPGWPTSLWIVLPVTAFATLTAAGISTNDLREIGRGQGPKSLSRAEIRHKSCTSLKTHGEEVMHHDLHTEIEIDAPPEAVWSVLTNLDDYPDWNPFITSASGALEVGQRLTNRLEPPNGKAMTIKPTVTVVEPGQTFEWLGHLGGPGVFDGRHRFELQATAAGGTRFVHSEHFNGLLVRVLRKSLDTQTRQGFVAMNEALKIRAEAASPGAA